MIRNRVSILVTTLTLTFLFPTLAVSQTESTPFDGKILTSNMRFPTTAKSKKAYFDKLRKQSKTKFREDIEKKQWKVYFAAFFRKPLRDIEVTVKIYDVTGKQKRLVAAFEKYLDRRGQKEVISYVKLERDKFGVNRQLEITLENQGKVLARGHFEILDEAEESVNNLSRS